MLLASFLGYQIALFNERFHSFYDHCGPESPPQAVACGRARWEKHQKQYPDVIEERYKADRAQKYR